MTNPIGSSISTPIRAAIQQGAIGGAKIDRPHDGDADDAGSKAPAAASTPAASISSTIGSKISVKA